jgi:hypothetical protein
MSRRSACFAPILALSCLSLIATPVLADSIDDVVDVLRAKGILSQPEYEALKQRMAAHKQETPTALQKPEPPAAFPAAAAPKPAPSPVGMMEKGIGVHIGPVDVSVSGEVNAFYVHDRVDKVPSSGAIAGGLASAGNTDSSSVRSGLLPGNFSIMINTVQKGLDIGITFGLYPGLNSVTQVGGANSAGSPQALGTSGIDFRQQFITVGNSRIGTFKAGRDIGMFGSEAILNDLTLLGVGSTGGGNIAPSNTSFGRIGLGYIYCDFIPQLTYMSPSFAGVQAGVGVFTPLDTVNFSGLSGALTGHDQPQFQAKLTYTLPTGTMGRAKAKLWTNGITQKLESNSAAEALQVRHSLQGSGIDYGGKLTIGGADILAYGYNGYGIGTTGLFFDAVTPSGGKRDSHGYYFQGAYTFNGKLTLTGSYGLSHLDLAPGEVNSSLMKDNSSEVGALRFKLTDWLSLVAEYTHTDAKSHGGNSTSSDSVAAGSFLFFGGQ